VLFFEVQELYYDILNIFSNKQYHIVNFISHYNIAEEMLNYIHSHQERLYKTTLKERTANARLATKLIQS